MVLIYCENAHNKNNEVQCDIVNHIFGIIDVIVQQIEARAYDGSWVVFMNQLI